MSSLNNNTFYDLYTIDKSVVQAPIALSVIFMAITSVGLVGNLGIVVLTYRSPRLRNTCNYLLGLLCLSDCLHQIGHFSYFYRMMAGHYFISLKACFLVQMFPMIGMLFGIILPIHQRINSTVYALLVFAVSGTYVGSIFNLVLQHVEKQGNSLVLCIVPDPILSDSNANFIFMSTCGLINLGAVLIYATVWIGLHVRKHVSDGTKRTFKALSAVVFALLFGWISTAIGQIVLLAVDAGPLQLFYSVMFSGICVNLVCAIGTIETH
ncbi:G-PROTEIN-RECEP-F1-2 domain-containing protein [Aphelenchoides besseyi]|nr:G-PROTEIN-RECEP-F1-2 domain-containing protein [Aphelenchoides besseyi]